MAIAVVDTTVLYSAGNKMDTRHEIGLEIIRAADSGELPVLRVSDPVLIETMNGLTRDIDHKTAVSFLDRLRAGSQFEPTRESLSVWQLGIELFEQRSQLSLADAIIVASMHHHGIEYCYSFDDDFDGIDGITRLATPDNPYTT